MITLFLGAGINYLALGVPGLCVGIGLSIGTAAAGLVMLPALNRSAK